MRMPFFCCDDVKGQIFCCGHLIFAGSFLWSDHIIKNRNEFAEKTNFAWREPLTID